MSNGKTVLGILEHYEAETKDGQMILDCVKILATREHPCEEHTKALVSLEKQIAMIDSKLSKEYPCEKHDKQIRSMKVYAGVTDFFMVTCTAIITKILGGK